MCWTRQEGLVDFDVRALNHILPADLFSRNHFTELLTVAHSDLGAIFDERLTHLGVIEAFLDRFLKHTDALLS